MVVAEGDKIGKNVFELAQHIEENLPDYEVRVSVLGHIQRVVRLLVLIVYLLAVWVSKQ